MENNFSPSGVNDEFILSGYTEYDWFENVIGTIVIGCKCCWNHDLSFAARCFWSNEDTISDCGAISTHVYPINTWILYIKKGICTSILPCVLKSILMNRVFQLNCFIAAQLDIKTQLNVRIKWKASAGIFISDKNSIPGYTASIRRLKPI